MIPLADLKKVCPQVSEKRLDMFIEPLNAAMDEYGISENLGRVTAFIAQIAHESGGFYYVRELASGEAYDTGSKAVALGNTPEDDGDGELYKGRGLIQITGRNNYRDCGISLDLDLLGHPELLEIPENACRSAGWFWQKHGLNELADAGDFLRITKRINGGTNGWEDRLAYYKRAQRVLT
ncbi:MAG: glycoside hydrolase family 19 protein [Sterolibacterium sp.]